MKNFSSYSFRPVPDGRVEVYQYGSLREIWHPWWDCLEIELCRGQADSDPLIGPSAVGAGPGFAEWRATIPPIILEAARIQKDREIAFLQLAALAPREMVRHARARPMVAWLLADEWYRRDPVARIEVARFARSRLGEIARSLDISGGRAGLRILAKLPPDLCYPTAAEALLMGIASARSRRVAAHYRGRWTLDVIETLQVPQVSDALLHLSAQGGEDRSIRALVIEVQDALGGWPYGRLPLNLERWEANIERSVARRYRNVRFPPPALPSPPWGEVVTTPAELKRLALRYRNCVWCFLDPILQGTTSVYFAEREEIGQDIAWVVEDHDGQLYLTEIAGSGNEPAEDHCREAVELWLAKGGRP